jgi:hypothetical protein
MEFEPCIHEPRNISPDWSLSFHATSPRDGERPDDQWEPLPVLRPRPILSSSVDSHPYASVVAARCRNVCVYQLARIVAAMNVPETPQLLDRCFALGSAKTQDFIDRMAPRPRPEARFGPGDILARTHQDLALSQRFDGDMIGLQVETPMGPVEEFAIDALAREAVAFVAHESLFQVRAIPGILFDEERVAIAEALEETGLFTRIRSEKSASAPPTFSIKGHDR